jgi:uncharacterized membrane protein YcaP (DUF421 family)
MSEGIEFFNPFLFTGMDKKDIHFNDLHRILFGEAPTIFLLEVFVRSLITYFVLLVATRWLGKRMSGQLSITEMAVMLTLGAIVSVAMQVPESGILMAVIVLMCTLTFERGLSWLEFKNKRIERISQGKLSILVKNGVTQPNEMLNVNISNQQLFATLRSEGIYNLGLVKRVYLEASGIFSIYKVKDEKPGLPLFPPSDPDLIKKHKVLALFACINCGLVKEPGKQEGKCEDCGHDEWTQAITTNTN